MHPSPAGTRLKRIRLPLLVAALITVLAACNPFSAPFYSVGLQGHGPDGTHTCPLLRFSAVLDGRTLTANHYPFMGMALDGTWVHDPRPDENFRLGSDMGMERNWPRRNAVITAEVECLDETETLIGRSVFSGTLAGLPRHPLLTVLNYQPEPGTSCQEPTSGTGVTLCATTLDIRLD